jgi:hypothetical protein
MGSTFLSRQQVSGSHRDRQPVSRYHVDERATLHSEAGGDDQPAVGKPFQHPRDDPLGRRVFADRIRFDLQWQRHVAAPSGSENKKARRTCLRAWYN